MEYILDSLQLEKVIDLLYLLPERIGSPLSINSFREEWNLRQIEIFPLTSITIMIYLVCIKVIQW